MAVKRKTAKKTTAKKATKTAAKKAPAKKAPAKKAAAKKAPAAKKALPDVVTIKHIAADIAERHALPKKQAETILTEFVGDIGAVLKKGKKARIAGLGIMQVRSYPARWGRNPATGEKIKIKARKKVAFRVAKDLKESVL